MSRKDYEAMAQIVKRAVNAAVTVRTVENGIGSDTRLSTAQAMAVESLAYDMALTFADDNARFDHVRFYEACGFTVENNYPQVFAS